MDTDALRRLHYAAAIACGLFAALCVHIVLTVFGLGLRGITVIVAQDGISGDPEFTETLTRWQLLNEPGFANPDNKPLDKAHVTLSTTDRITFK